MASENHSAEKLLLSLARFGDEVSRSMAESTDTPEFLSNAPLLVLCLLDLEGPGRPGVIGDVVGLTSGGTTKLLDRMEGAGLIHRSYGAIDSDHRGVKVELTARGRGLLHSATSAMVAHLPEAKSLVKDIVGLMQELEASESS
jgi:DNA-binding MarR family transcriptional regulator